MLVTSEVMFCQCALGGLRPKLGPPSQSCAPPTLRPRGCSFSPSHWFAGLPPPTAPARVEASPHYEESHTNSRNSTQEILHTGDPIHRRSYTQEILRQTHSRSYKILRDPTPNLTCKEWPRNGWPGPDTWFNLFVKFRRKLEVNQSTPMILPHQVSPLNPPNSIFDQILFLLPHHQNWQPPEFFDDRTFFILELYPIVHSLLQEPLIFLQVILASVGAWVKVVIVGKVTNARARKGK